jgi:hypothetical protein
MESMDMESTMDNKFRRERRSTLNREPGFAESGDNLFRGIFAAVTAVITQPIKGVKEEGFGGLQSWFKIFKFSNLSFVVEVWQEKLLVFSRTRLLVLLIFLRIR